MFSKNIHTYKFCIYDFYDFYFIILEKLDVIFSILISKFMKLWKIYEIYEIYENRLENVLIVQIEEYIKSIIVWKFIYIILLIKI